MPKASSKICSKNGGGLFFCKDLVDGDNLLYDYGSECGSFFRRKGDLTRHRKIHTGVKEHICTYCGKSFHQASQLKSHVNTHTGHRPYVCGICEEKFGDPSSRCRHRKEQHEGDFICYMDFCQKAFGRRGGLAKHLKEHDEYPSPERLKSCWVPRESLSQPRPLRKPATLKTRKGNPERAATKIEYPQGPSLDLRERRPVSMPQTAKFEPTSNPYPTLLAAGQYIPYATQTAEQSHETQGSVQHIAPMPSQWQKPFDNTPSSSYSAPLLTPPSLYSSPLSSLSPSPDPLCEGSNPIFQWDDLYLPCDAHQQPRFKAPSPLFWSSFPVALDVFPLAIDEFGQLFQNFVVPDSC